MRMQQKGFTLVELIVVIVILGILAATALPRFINVTNQARLASLDGFAGGLTSSIGMVQAAWIAQGSSGTSATMADNTVVTVSSTTGLPVSTTTGIPRAIRCDSTTPTSCNGYTGAFGATAVFTQDNAPTPANCAVTYDPATGSVTKVNTGC